MQAEFQEDASKGPLSELVWEDSQKRLPSFGAGEMLSAWATRQPAEEDVEKTHTSFIALPGTEFEVSWESTVTFKAMLLR